MVALVAFVLLGIAVVAAAYGITIYNSLVQLKHEISRVWANIDVLLKQRHDELPKLVETCKQYMSYEQQTLTKVMEARASVFAAQQRGDLKALGAAEQQLRAGLGSLFAVAENYPELKGNESFRHLQERISGLENQIADRREMYNEAVNNFNVRIEQFPDVLVARNLQLKPAELLEFSDDQTVDVDLKAAFA